VKLLRNIIDGVQNLITWAPIIWKDRQWDHYHFFCVMEKKLDLMTKYFEESDIAEGNDIVSEQIKEARDIIKRLKEDEYEDSLLDELYKKYGEPKLEFKKDGTIFFNNENKHNEEYHKELVKVYKKADSSRNLDVLLFCSILKKHVFEWWD
jgi:hypothetical protein